MREIPWKPRVLFCNPFVRFMWRNIVSKLRVQSFAISIDGYGAGPNQDLQNPLGVSGPELMEWFFHTRVWRRMHGDGGWRDGRRQRHRGARLCRDSGPGFSGATCSGPSAARGRTTAGRAGGAMSRRITRPVFVLTHHPRPPLRMAGGTEFRFVTEGIHAALEQATAAAGGRDVRLGGGVSTIRQYLQAGLIDELHLAIRPVLLGSGEHLLNGIDMRALGYECAKYVAGERATHVFLHKRR